jgi:hypothetical protein
VPKLRSIPTRSNTRRIGNDEAASYLGIAPATLAKSRVTGALNIPYFKVGRRVTYSVADLDAFLDRHRHGGPEAA